MQAKTHMPRGKVYTFNFVVPSFYLQYYLYCCLGYPLLLPQTLVYSSGVDFTPEKTFDFEIPTNFIWLFLELHLALFWRRTFSFHLLRCCYDSCLPLISPRAFISSLLRWAYHQPDNWVYAWMNQLLKAWIDHSTWINGMMWLLPPTLRSFFETNNC